MLRFAQSPQGDMHIGDLRIALFNYLTAKERGEDFIVRIEDGDKEKNIEGKDQEIVDLLALFNIEYTQIIYQSQNFKFHSAMALQLLHDKKAFACFCSSEWLKKKRQEAQEANVEYKYDDACRNLPAELVIDNTAPFTVRITRPEKDIMLHDIVQGDINFNSDKVDSFVIMHQDKTPTHNFASAVDDMLTDISIVVAQENKIEDAPKQIHIRNQLSYNKEIAYAHLPSLESEVSVKSLLEEGYLPDAIANYLIVMGNDKWPKDIFTLDDAQKWFRLESVSNTPVIFDLQKLKEINQKHLQKMDAIELSRYVGFADAEIGELARLYLDEDVVTTRDLKLKITPIFGERNIPATFKEQAEKMAQIIKKAPYFEHYSDFKAYLEQEIVLQEESFLIVLRILLTNTQDGPEMADIYKYLKNYIGEIVK